MANPNYLVIYLNESKSHYWYPPFQSIKLDSSDLQKIKTRIKAVLDCLKINITLNKIVEIIARMKCND